MNPHSGIRQLAKVHHFPADIVPYVNWQKIAAEADELAADFDVARDDEGALTVTVFWRNCQTDEPTVVASTVLRVADVLRTMMGATAADPYIRAIELTLGMRR